MARDKPVVSEDADLHEAAVGASGEVEQEGEGEALYKEGPKGLPVDNPANEGQICPGKQHSRLRGHNQQTKDSSSDRGCSSDKGTQMNVPDPLEESNPLSRVWTAEG